MTSCPLLRICGSKASGAWNRIWLSMVKLSSLDVSFKTSEIHPRDKLQLFFSLGKEAKEIRREIISAISQPSADRPAAASSLSRVNARRYRGAYLATR